MTKIPLSEDYGRKPLIIVGLLGYIVLNIAFFINSWFMYELKAEYLLFECLQDLFGGDIVFSLGIYSLLVDKTAPEARTRRMSILQVAAICSVSSWSYLIFVTNPTNISVEKKLSCGEISDFYA